MRLHRFLAPMVAAVAACSSSSSSSSSAGVDAGGAADGRVLPSGTLVWKPTSARIELTVKNQFNGSWGYIKNREDLSAEQLSGLEQMKTMAFNRGGFAASLDAFEIKITDRDGSIGKFQAVDRNLHGAADRAITPIDFGTMAGFLETTKSCRRGAKAVARTSSTRLDPSTATESEMNSLSADPGCLNGVRLAQGCSDTLYKITPATNGSLTFSVHRCADIMSLRLYTGDGKTMLEEAALGGGTGDPCVSLAATVASTDSYLLLMTRTTPDCSQPGRDTPDVLVRMHPTE